MFFNVENLATASQRVRGTRVNPALQLVLLRMRAGKHGDDTPSVGAPTVSDLVVL